MTDQKRTPPVDPRLLRYARASRGFFVAIAAVSAGQTVVIVLFAWLLTRAIVGAIDGMPSADLAATLIALAAVVAARAVLMWWQDWISGLTVLLTLPLIPLFMVLIGMATRSVQQRQWQTLQRLAARFADTVQGLSTLKVYGRQHRAAASIEQVTGEYRVETMRVLRVSFLSGFALEFLASISVALVAVSIGFRLLNGSLALMVGLFVLLLAPEAYLPLRQVG